MVQGREREEEKKKKGKEKSMHGSQSGFPSERRRRFKKFSQSWAAKKKKWKIEFTKQLSSESNIHPARRRGTGWGDYSTGSSQGRDLGSQCLVWRRKALFLCFFVRPVYAAGHLTTLNITHCQSTDTHLCSPSL